MVRAVETQVPRQSQYTSQSNRVSQLSKWLTLKPSLMPSKAEDGARRQSKMLMPTPTRRLQVNPLSRKKRATRKLKACLKKAKNVAAIATEDVEAVAVSRKTKEVFKWTQTRALSFHLPMWLCSQPTQVRTQVIGADEVA